MRSPKKTIALIASGLMVLLTASSFVAPINATTSATGNGPLTAEIIEQNLGYVPETVEFSTWTAEGWVTETLTWAEGKAVLAELAGGIGATGDSSGPDLGQGDGQILPFCDDSSGWVQYPGETPGASVTINEELGPSDPICGNAFGQAANRIIQLAAPADQQFSGCYADIWTLGSPGYCPPKNWATFTSVGPSALYSFAFFGITFDYSLGLGATILRQ